MMNDNNEKKLDYDFFIGKGLTDYSDGDIMVLDNINASSMEGTVKVDMVLMIYCIKGRLQGEMNGKVHLAKAGDVVICLPSSYLSNSMMSPDFECKIIGFSYKSMQNTMQMTRDALDLLAYVAKNPVVHLDLERQALVSKYYAIIAHKIKHPHGYFHKEIMHGIFQCAAFELCAIIAPHVEYSNEIGRAHV